MSWIVAKSEKSRHVVLRASAGELLPEGLSAMLRDERIVAGWLRGSGVVEDVELRAYDTALGAFGSPRRIEGPVQLLALEGSIGVSDGEASTSLRAVLARQTDRGLETLAGELSRARAVALEIFITCLDDLSLERSFDEPGGLWLVRPSTGTATSDRSARAERAPAAPWSAAVDASDQSNREPRRRAPGGASPANAPMPARPVRAGGPDVDGPLPETGDLVDHFAFGLCEVLKTDGDRIHFEGRKRGARQRDCNGDVTRFSSDRLRRGQTPVQAGAPDVSRRGATSWSPRATEAHSLCLTLSPLKDSAVPGGCSVDWRN